LASFDMFFFVTGSSKPELFGTEETLLLAPPVSPSPLFFVLYNICIVTSVFCSFRLIIWTGAFSKTEKYWWRKLQENYKYRLTICYVTLSISRIKKICVSNFFSLDNLAFNSKDYFTCWMRVPEYYYWNITPLAQQLFLHLENRPYYKFNTNFIILLGLVQKKRHLFTSLLPCSMLAST
jgi:hypothetical protein